MAIHGMSAEDRFEASSHDILDRFGIQLTRGHDFEEYKWHVAEARPDHNIGDPFNPETQIGPLVSREHDEKVLRYMTAAKQSGARHVCGGDAL